MDSMRTRFIFEPVAKDGDYLYWYGQKLRLPSCGDETKIWSEVSLVARSRRHPQGIEISERTSPRSLAKFFGLMQPKSKKSKYNFSAGMNELRVTTPSNEQMMRIATVLGASVDSFLTGRSGHYTHQSGSQTIHNLASTSREDLFYSVNCGQILKAKVCMMINS